MTGLLQSTGVQDMLPGKIKYANTKKSLKYFLTYIFYRMTVHGETLNEFTHSCLEEPTHLTVDSKKNRIIVADGVNNSVLVFNIIGELLLKVSAFSLIYSMRIRLKSNVVIFIVGQKRM